MNQEEKKDKREKKKHYMLKTIKKVVELVLNPRFLLCFGLAWIITNGWAYAILGIGIWTKIGWMVAVASGYLAFIWVPLTPEKIITIAISIFLLRVFFPKDEKTLGVLREWYTKAKKDIKTRGNGSRTERIKGIVNRHSYLTNHRDSENGKGGHPCGNHSCGDHNCH